MGAYLDKPVKEKVSSDSENKFLKCGVSSMQGWRVSQEDAHNCILDFDADSSLFAVYDGHGGHEVAEYTSNHLPEFIRELDSYKKGEYEEALKEAFLGFDALLISGPVLTQLKEIAESKKKDLLLGREGNSSDEDEVEEEVDVKTLKKEAQMPLTELIAHYAINELQKVKMASKNKESDSEVTSSTNETAKPSENAETNGECELVKIGKKEDASCTSEQDNIPSSSSEINGDVNCVDKSKSERLDNDNNSVGDQPPEVISKKQAFIDMYKSFLEESYASDSDDNDDSFKAGEANTSSEDEEENMKEKNGSAEDNEEKGNEEAEEEEEEEVDDEDDDDDDDDDDEEENEEEDGEKDFKKEYKKEEPGIDSGCTAVVCLVLKEALYVANAGDSRAVLCRGGEAIDLSVDHKPDDVTEMNRIVAAGGEVNWDGRINRGLNLSRALGDHLYKKSTDLDPTEQMIIALPDIRIEKIDPLQDEFIIIACDGIWNSLTSQEAIDFVRPLIQNGDKLSVVCEKLFDHCLAPAMNIVLCDGRGSDNMTCIIVQFIKDNKETLVASKRHSDSPLKETSTKKVKVDSEVEN